MSNTDNTTKAGFERLQRSLTDIVKEQQAKLGYRKEIVRRRSIIFLRRI